MSPEAVVQVQLEAYNARDLNRFTAVYADAIRVFRPPAQAPAIEGKAAFAEYYRTQRFNCAGLHAEVRKRIVMGNKVIDHERISGLRESAFEAAAVYEVVDGLIRTVWFFAPD